MTTILYGYTVAPALRYTALVFCTLMLGSMPADAAENPLHGKAEYRAAHQAAWQVVRTGELRADGFTSAAQVRAVQRTGAGSYMPNVLVVKTRRLFRADKGGSVDFSAAPALQTGLRELGALRVEAPFESFHYGSLLSADEHGVGRIYHVQYSAAVDAREAAQKLSADPDVEYAEPVFLRYPDHTPNDPLLAQQYALERIGAAAAWDVSRGSENVIIAIVDSGTDWEHEDLGPNIWQNPGEIPNNGTDDDGNGKVDDHKGWDFVGNITLSQAQSRLWAEDNNPKVAGSADWRFDDRSHGTVVAGAAAAVTNNNKGMAALGYRCRILPIKCGSDQTGVPSIYRGYEAILYAAQLGAQIINCSWGGTGYSQAEQDIIDQATALGSLVVTSSGNEGLMTDLELERYPSNYRNVLNVGAVNSAGRATDFSNYGMNTHVYAPGVGILSTVPANGYQDNYWTGTSFASPIVSGLAGLVLSVHPDWTPRQVLQHIRSTCDNVVAESTAERPWYYGQINAAKAMTTNQNFSSGNRVPGVSMAALGFSNSAGALVDTEPTTLRISLRNYLAPTANLRVTLTSLDGYLTVAEESVNLGAIGTLADKDADFSVTLSPYAPWYEGFADVLLSYTDGSYVDFERIRVPIDRASGNRTSFVNFPGAIVDELQNIRWYAAHSPQPSALWVSGVFIAQSSQVGIAFRSSDLSVQALAFGSTFSNLPSYAIHGRSAAVAYAGTNQPAGGSAAILRTTNGGQSWTSTSVSSITGFINAIHFFDDNNGIMLGDPDNRQWGVATTSNSGASWQRVTGMPQANTGETGLAGAACWLGDYGWFGTTKGRVFLTTNRGQSWSVRTIVPDAHILALSFVTPEKGIAVYRESSSTDAPTFVAATSNGGLNWQSNRFALEDANTSPVAVYGPENSLQNLLVGSRGQILGTVDNGDNWAPVLSRWEGAAITGAGVLNGNRVRLWRVHDHGVSYSDSEFMLIPKEKDIQVSKSTLLFGGVRINESINQGFVIRSAGTQAITFDNVSFGSDDFIEGEFSLLNELPAELASGAELGITVVFAPQKTGNRNATLTIEGDFGEPYVLSLRGVGLPAITNTVGELAQDGLRLLAATPNPAEYAVHLAFALETPAFAELEVLDRQGRVVARPFSGMAAAGTHSVRLATDTFAPGVYLYRLRTGTNILSRSFVVLR